MTIKNWVFIDKKSFVREQGWSRLLENASKLTNEPLKFSDNNLCGQGLKTHKPINMPSRDRKAEKFRRYVSEGTLEEPFCMGFFRFNGYCLNLNS